MSSFTHHRPTLDAATMDAIAALLGFGTTRENHDEFWSASVQAGGKFAVVTHNASHPAFMEMPTDGTASETGFTRAEANALTLATGVVVALSPLRVARRSLPPTPTIVAPAVDSANPLTGAIHTARDRAFPSLHTLCVTAESVTMHPFVDGRVVYVWKYDGEVYFSTTRRVDGGISRGCDGARLDAESWWACGGDRIEAYFPDPDDRDGGGLAFAFAICHPDLVRRSRVNVGAGYVVFLGAVDSATGDVVGVDDPRVRLDPDCFTDPAAILGVAVPPMSSAEPYPDVEGGDADEEARPGVEACEATVDACVESHLAAHAPFPPPSSATLPFPPRGGANATVRRCLYDERPTDDPSPGVYAIPRFATVDEANEFLTVGYYTEERAAANGAPHLFQSPVTATIGAGEAVVIRATFADAATAPFGVKTLFVKVAPACDVYRAGVVGNGTNFNRRAMEMRSLADAAVGRVLEDQAVRAPPRAFDYAPFVTGGMLEVLAASMSARTDRERRDVPSVDYEALFGSPLATAPWVRAIASSRGLAVMHRLLADAESTGEPIVHLPISEFASIASEMPPSPLLASEIRDVLFGWACLVLSTCLSAAHSAVPVRAFLSSVKNEARVDDVVRLLAARLGSPPSRARVSEAYTALKADKSLVDKRGRVCAAADCIVRSARSTAIRVANGEAAESASRSAVMILSGEELYAARRAVDRVADVLRLA